MPSECHLSIWQGLTADKCVVMADLHVAGKSMGAHAFLMNFRENGKLVPGTRHLSDTQLTLNRSPGVTIGDMGVKTIGNDLDNAWVQFTNVWLPKAPYTLADGFTSLYTYLLMPLYMYISL